MTDAIAETTGRIAIVGGGIVGTSLAYFLRHASRPVSVFEKRTLGSATTAASIAQFIQHQDAPSRAEYDRRRRAWEWYEPRVASGEFSFERVGTLHLGEDEPACEEVRELASAHAAFGLPTEVFDADRLGEFGLDPDALSCGFFLPEDGYLDPAEIVQYLAAAAREAGVTFETGVTVTDVRTREGAVAGVETTAGPYDADVVINAAGPWAPDLNDRVGVDAPLRHTTGPILVLEAERPTSLPLTFFEDSVYLRSEGERQLLAGKFATGYDDAERVNPDHSASVDEAFYLDVAEVIERYLPSLGSVGVQNEWVGRRTVTPDGRPIVGETAVDGYVLAVGMSGYGITLAPVVGDLVATWLQSGTRPSLLAPLGPSRFE